MDSLNAAATSVDHTTMGGMLRWQAVYRPDEVAITCDNRSRTWSELNRVVNQVANALRDLGIASGQSIAIMLSNRFEYVDIYLACAKLGVAAAPVNYQFAASEVAHVINDSGAVAVVHDSAKSALVADLVENASIRVQADRILEVGGPDSSYGSLVAVASADEPEIVATDDEVFFIGYTSGTTGFPKGCVQKHRSFVQHYRLAQMTYPHRPDEIMLIPGPLFHEAPTLFTLAHLFSGGRIILMSAFDPAEALRTIERHRCTAIGFAVPTMLDRMCEQGAVADTTSVRNITVGGSPLHASAIERSLELFPSAELDEFYGATEIGLASNIGHRKEGRAGSCGRPFPGMSVAIFDDDGRPLGPQAKGTVYITPLLMEGYLNNEAATEASTLEHGGVSWFTLGDLGYLDEDGYLYLVDRKSHMIISGGENVYPAEVESVLNTHPNIDDVAVVGAPDERWGEAVVAVVVSRSGAPTLEEIREFLDGRLARYKWPRQLVEVDELPRTPSGKVQKHRLRVGERRT